VAAERETAGKFEAQAEALTAKLRITRRQLEQQDARAAQAERTLSDYDALRVRDQAHLQELTVAVIKHKEEAEVLRTEVENLQAVCTNYASAISVAARERAVGAEERPAGGCDERPVLGEAHIPPSILDKSLRSDFSMAFRTNKLASLDSETPASCSASYISPCTSYCVGRVATRTPVLAFIESWRSVLALASWTAFSAAAAAISEARADISSTTGNKFMPCTLMFC
jgi:hypothetical protein